MRHLLNLRKANLVFSFLLLLITGILPVRADDMRDRFCVVPVLGFEPTAADVGEVWRRTNFQHRIPGLPYLVFTSTNRPDPWIVDEDRRLSPYHSPFPRDYLDLRHWVREPWSGRVVALNWHGPGNVSVLKQGSQRI